MILKLVVLLLVCSEFSYGFPAESSSDLQNAANDDNSQELKPEKNRPPTDKRVINGKNAEANAWPWQVSLQLREDSDHFCGGSIISREWILTAAHCVEGKAISSFYVVVGEHDTSSPSRVERNHKVTELILHKDYDTVDIDSDIALLRLKTPIRFHDKVHAIHLPEQDDRATPGAKCFLTGWGRTIGHDKDSHSDILKEKETAIVDDDRCAKTNGHYFDRSTMICAGGRGHSFCKGDSGGPLSCLENGDWVVRGVANWIYKGCLTYKYSVYARVSTFADWIRDKIDRPLRH